MSIPAPLPKNNKLSGAGLPWPVHPACEIWPVFSPAALMALSDDIAANGVRDPTITLTPAGELLDGRNRALEGKHEYWIAGKGDAAKDEEIAKLKAKVAELEAELDQATAPARVTVPAKATAPATAMAN